MHCLTLHNHQVMQQLLITALKVSLSINSEKSITCTILNKNKILTFSYDASTYKVTEVNEYYYSKHKVM